MRKATTFFSSILIYFCVATVIAQMTAFAALWFKGSIDRDRAYRVLAALHGKDIVTLHQRIADAENAADSEQPSYQARTQINTLKSLDLDLRENAIDKGIQDLTSLQLDLEKEQGRFENLKKSYDARLKSLADEEQATSLKEVQRTLEAIRPDQAKEQLVKMIDDNAMDDVVTIMKSMAIDKRKKIIAEFKQGPDTEQLYEILKNIRMGEPVVSQIEEARKQLNDPGPSK